MARALHDDGYVTEIVDDGEAAWEMARRANPPFGLVITNTWIGTTAGDDLMTALRARYPGLPILHLSAAPERDRHDFDHGAPPRPEPFSVPRFLRTVRGMLAESDVAG